MRISLCLQCILLSFITSCGTDSKNKYAIKEDEELKAKFKSLANAARMGSIPILFRLDTLTKYTWDTVIILTPYIDINKVEKELSVDLSETKSTAIMLDEVSNVLAFVKDGRLISFAEIGRGLCDFAYVADSNRIFTKDNCLFEMSEKNEIENGWVICEGIQVK